MIELIYKKYRIHSTSKSFAKVEVPTDLDERANQSKLKQ